MPSSLRSLSRACFRIPSGSSLALVLLMIDLLAPLEGPAQPSPLQISPSNVVVAVWESLALIASGGTPPYTFAIVTSNSGGSVNPASGVYTAGSTAGVSDTVRVTDAANASALLVVLVSVPPFVQESFEGVDYTNGAPLPGLNGGFGFAAPWTENRNSLLVANIDFGSYPTFGQGARMQSGDQSVIFTRLLAPAVFPASSQTFWLSYLVSNRGRRADLLVHIDRRFYTGMDSFENSRMKLDLDLDAAPALVFVDVAGAGTGPFLVVARFENFNSGGPGNPQTGTLWILTADNYKAIGNAGFTEAALEANNTARLTQSTASATGFTEGRLNVEAFSGTTPVFDFDEIKLGPTFASVLAASSLQPSPLSITPTNTVVLAGRTQTFAASGGSPPYTFSFEINNSGASINSASGLYTAGSGDVTDTVRVTDALGATALATVNVTLFVSFAVRTFDGDLFGLGAGSSILAGVAIAVTGSASTNGVTDSSGQYALSLPASGSYTFTPSRPHYGFTPASLSVANPTSASVFLVFTGRVDRFSVSGVVTNPAGTPLQGVSVLLNPALSGAAGSANSLNGSSGLQTLTDASGRYDFSNVRAGDSYLVVPARTGFIFDPSSALISELSGPQARNFRGTETNRTINVHVAHADSTGVAGVTVVLSRETSGSAFFFSPKNTDANGNTNFTNIPPEPGYRVTPSHPNLAFSPASQTVSLVDGDQTVNFIARQSFTISGQISPGLGVDAGAVAGPTAVFFDDAATGTNITSSVTTLGNSFAGNYTSLLLPEGRSYVVRPSKPGLEFTPPTRTVSNLAGNVFGIDFTAAPFQLKISGRVTNSAGFGLSAPQVFVLDGAVSTSPIVDAEGRYSFNASTGHTYTVSAVKSNFTFNPISALLQNVTTSRTQNFLGTPPFPLTGRIAFFRNKELMVMNADSSALLKIPMALPHTASFLHTPGRPALSADGTKVAYVPQMNPSGGASFPLVVQNVDGSDVRLLTAVGELLSLPASWSPGGTHVAVVIQQSGIRPAGIYLINIDGSSAFRLPNSTGNQKHGMSWSPDGTKIAFTEFNGGVHRLYVTGTNDLDAPQPQSDQQTLDPAWSPDGTQIACRPFDPAVGDAIGIRNFPEDLGLPARQLTFLNRPLATPSWSPDGTLLAFSDRSTDQSSSIYVMNADGTMITPLVRGIYPSWSRAPGLTTSPGNNVTVSNGIAAVTFSTVTALGTTTVIPMPPPQNDVMPPGYVSISGGPTLMNFEITTTASNSGPIILCFTLTNITNSVTFDSLRILHNENGVLVDRTLLPPDPLAPNFATKQICARVDFLSPFSIAELVNPSRPMIVGMVVDAAGNPLGDIDLRLNDSLTVSTRTDASGSFTFPNLAPGADHVVLPSDARYDFNPPAGIITSATGTNTLAFVATPKAAPALSIAPDPLNPGLFLLMWPASQDYDVEFTDSLAAPEWTTLGAQPAFVNGNNIVLVQSSNATRFFRLRKL